MATESNEYREGYADAQREIATEHWTVEIAQQYLRECDPLDDDYDRGHRAAIAVLASNSTRMRLVAES